MPQKKLVGRQDYMHEMCVGIGIVDKKSCLPPKIANISCLPAIIFGAFPSPVREGLSPFLMLSYVSNLQTAF